MSMSCCAAAASERSWSSAFSCCVVGESQRDGVEGVWRKEARRRATRGFRCMFASEHVRKG
eukprot:1383985-Rhodomonas_salina.2